MRWMLAVTVGAMLTTTTQAKADEPRWKRSVSVLTMNLQNPMLPGKADERLELVADFIRTREPDFVTLQEVTERRGQTNRAAALREKTGYQMVWTPTHRAGGYQEGMAILSRYPIISSERHELPKVETFGLNRALLGVRAHHPAGDVDVFVTHLAAFTTSSLQARQATDILHWMRQTRPGMPKFLGGDMNAEPDAPAMRVLRTELTDSWPQSLHGGDGATYPASNPKRRIDALYYRDGSAVAVDSVRCEVVLGEEVNGLRTSDHRGVLCTYLLRDAP